jgi:hypothetical protein
MSRPEIDLKDLAKFHNFTVRTFYLEALNTLAPKRQSNNLIIEQFESAFSGKTPGRVNIIDIQRDMIHRA